MKELILLATVSMEIPGRDKPFLETTIIKRYENTPENLANLKTLKSLYDEDCEILLVESIDKD